MSIVPPLNCPPDYSIQSIRLVDCKKIGVVKGIEKLVSIEMKDFFIPIANYEERYITLRAGQTKELDVSDVAMYYPQQESYAFPVNTAILGTGTNHIYTLYDENLNTIGNVQFTVQTDFGDDFATAISNGPVAIRSAMTYVTASSTGTTNISATAKSSGLKYRHVFQFNLNIAFQPYHASLVHPGNLVSKSYKYPEGRVKAIMIYPQYEKVVTSAGCNCTNESGQLKSNVKWFNYLSKTEYESRVYPKTLTTATLAQGATSSFNWDQSSANHIGYYFKSGDGISLGGNTGAVASVESINGYAVNVSGYGVGTTGQQNLYKANFPVSLPWKKAGDFMFLTGGQDVSSTDELYIESVWLNNPQGFDIPVRVLIAS
jgi:hypothetical protein